MCDKLKNMKVLNYFLGFIIFLFLYSIVVPEVPYGLDRLPTYFDEITTSLID